MQLYRQTHIFLAYILTIQPLRAVAILLLVCQQTIQAAVSEQEVLRSSYIVNAMQSSALCMLWQNHPMSIDVLCM